MKIERSVHVGRVAGEGYEVPYSLLPTLAVVQGQGDEMEVTKTGMEKRQYIQPGQILANALGIT